MKKLKMIATTSMMVTSMYIFFSKTLDRDVPIIWMILSIITLLYFLVTILLDYITNRRK